VRDAQIAASGEGYEGNAGGCKRLLNAVLTGFTAQVAKTVGVL
jgi:hypothetical protein